MKYEIKYPNKNIKIEDIIEDFKRIAKELNKNTVTQDDYEKHGKYACNNIYRKIGSWPKALELEELSISNIGRNISNIELFENLEKVWIRLGRQPKYSEMCKPLSEFNVSTYERRFGGWIKALESFAEFVSEEDKVQVIEENLASDVILKKKRTSRSINLRLRFKVMMRDGFRCCKCGKSPAIDRCVELEVDHVLPWSKGGETELENLQTLCFECNQGKGNMIED